MMLDNLLYVVCTMAVVTAVCLFALYLPTEEEDHG